MTTANPNGRVFWAGLLLILTAFTATAQEFRGSLAGKITDPNGAVVPNSKVEIKNVETGVASTTVTDEDGSYSFALKELADVGDSSGALPQCDRAEREDQQSWTKQRRLRS
jgi:hypothetical protein